MTRVLVAPRRGQGLRPDDFCWASPGELVYLSLICAQDDGDPPSRKRLMSMASGS